MSGHWFRMYDDVINDPKVMKLPEATRWHWVGVLCAASKHGGIVPPADELAFLLRMTDQRAASLVAELLRAGLLDKVDGGGFAPHNWEGRQYKSNGSAERVKRFRGRHRNVTRNVTGSVTGGVTSETEPVTGNVTRNVTGNVTGGVTGNVTSETEPVTCNVTAAVSETPMKRRRNVTETPPDTDTDTDSEANASDATASDPRTRLFRDGLAKLAKLTGKGPDACRSFVGKCLKAAGDDAVTVLGLIEDAERNQVVDPSAWIAVRLKGPSTNGQFGSKIIQAADDLRRTIAQFDGPPGGADELRSGASAAPVRLLSHG